jgi:hypothetical protein
MPATVASRVTAEIYRGLDLPADWADKPTDISVALAREHLISVMVMLDADEQPLAACWRAGEGEEHFARIRFDEGAEPDLLDRLDDDLEHESLRVGVGDLLATMLWEPTEIRPDQGDCIHKIVFVRGRWFCITGWNEATREIAAAAPNLVLMKREVEEGLALPVPKDAGEMHAVGTSGDTILWLVKPFKPGEVAAQPSWKDMLTTRLMIAVWALLAAALLIGACADKFGWYAF